jgi:hypothetical protein
MPHHSSREWSVKRNLLGQHYIIVRQGIPDVAPGCWKWGKWRKANQSEVNAAIIALVGLNKD